MADIVYRDYVTVDTVDMGRVLCVAPFCSLLRPGDMVIIQKDPIVAPDTSISGIGKNIGVVVASASFSDGSDEAKLLMTLAKTDRNGPYRIIGTVFVRMFEEEEG